MTATNEPIEKTKKVKVPGMPNDALLKSAELAFHAPQFSWRKDDYGRDETRLFFFESKIEIIAPTNTWVISKLLDRHEEQERSISALEQTIAELQQKLEDKANA